MRNLRSTGACRFGPSVSNLAAYPVNTGETVQVQILHASRWSSNDTVIDDERYLRACLHHTDGVYRMHVGERLVNKIFSRVFQSHAMGRLVIAYFESQAVPGTRRPTLAWLQAQSGGGRTLAAFIGAAKVFKLVSSVESSSDRRQKHLVPSQRIIDGLRQWLAHHFEFAESMGIMAEGSADRLRRDEDYFARFVSCSMPMIDGIVAIQQRYVLWNWFEKKECGLRIAYAYLNAHCRACLVEVPPVDAPVWFAISGERVARDLGLSKSHVRNVINGAERCRIVIHDARRRKVCLSSEFISDARGSFEALLRLMVEAHDRAERLQSKTHSDSI